MRAGPKTFQRRFSQWIARRGARGSPEAGSPQAVPPETADAAVQRIAGEIQVLRVGEPWAHFEAWQARGLHILPVHFYSPVPDTSSLTRERPAPSAMVGIELHEEAQLDLVANVFPRFASEFPGIDDGGSQFGGTDALALYAMLRHLRPSRIVEVGGGESTDISLRALRANGTGAVTSIDPFPSAALRAAESEGAHVIAEPVQSVPLSVFEALGPNDVLFIDSTHVIKADSDVAFLYLEVLPRLKQGVSVHIHDVFLPFDYPRPWLIDKHLLWNEQYLLQAFLCLNRDFSVVLANHWVGQLHHDLLKRTFPDARWWGGGSFWMRRDSAPPAGT
jgi:hypothetical protein